MILIFEGLDKREYEVKCRTLDKLAADYIFDNLDLFTDTKNPARFKEHRAACGEIWKQQAEGWRLIQNPEAEWTPADKQKGLPNEVYLAAILRMLELSQGVAKERIDLEKN